MQCNTCNGTGKKVDTDGVEDCRTCMGSGQVTCPTCGGSGKVSSGTTCKICAGQG